MQQTDSISLRFLTGALGVALCVAGPMSAEAQFSAKTVSRDVREISGSADLRIVDGQIELSLDDAIAMALERNLALNVERYRQSESQFSLKASEGIYDLTLTGTASAFEDTSPTTTNLSGADVQITE